MKPEKEIKDKLEMEEKRVKELIQQIPSQLDFIYAQQCIVTTLKWVLEE